ncbi:VOC family protein [Phytomonospora sp. NPDC050363]|uniref:VOC family protein n=1 Tax=Phytomonospora sp. NPDC050363 TaxID=3155642 RepID=UPI0033C3B48B
MPARASGRVQAARERALPRRRLAPAITALGYRCVLGSTHMWTIMIVAVQHDARFKERGPLSGRLFGPNGGVGVAGSSGRTFTVWTGRLADVGNELRFRRAPLADGVVGKVPVAGRGAEEARVPRRDRSRRVRRSAGRRGRGTGSPACSPKASTGRRPTPPCASTEPATSARNRVHLDLATSSRAHQAELIARLRDAGATPADVGQGEDVSWTVLADPEGAELCVLAPG